MILRIVSPEKVIYKGEVQMVKLPGTVGQFTVLENHAPLVSTLTPGEIIYKGVEEEKSVQIIRIFKSLNRSGFLSISRKNHYYAHQKQQSSFHNTVIYFPQPRQERFV